MDKNRLIWLIQCLLLMMPRVVTVTHYNVENKHYILKKLSLHSDHQLLIVLNLVLTIGLGTT